MEEPLNYFSKASIISICKPYKNNTKGKPEAKIIYERKSTK